MLSGLTVEEMRDGAEAGDEIERELARLKHPRCGAPPRSVSTDAREDQREPFDSEDWLFEIKYDGVRVLAIRDGGKCGFSAAARDHGAIPK